MPEWDAGQVSVSPDKNKLFQIQECIWQQHAHNGADNETGSLTKATAWRGV